MAMNDIRKENDMFVSTLLNPEAKVSDLVMNGITGENTGLLTPDVYKDSPFVKSRFSDKDGNFKQEEFENAYINAAKKYDDLTSIQTWDDFEKILSEYNPNDLYASEFEGRTYNPSYDVKKVLNPLRVSEGVVSLFEKGANTMSMRELAQQSKIWDSDKQEWLDETADERGLLGSLFGKPLVYATWDEDGQHFDKTLGRTVNHRKGDWKTNDSGQFYTETIGNREAYDKQFVAASDTLTKEDSWLNKVDFFDSDGLSKNPVGTTFKMVATIAPYMIPNFNVFWGGVTAAIGLSTVMPTFAKMLEGLALPEGDTAFTRKMNTLENFWKKFDESYSDDAQDSTFGYQKMASMVSDVFGQLYQMRAMSSLSFLKNTSLTKQSQKSLEQFAKNFGPQYFAAADQGLVENSVEGMVKFWKEIAAKTPEIKSILDSQSKLAKRLSLGYMALTSSADVYQDAIQGGYDRRMAGLAGLIATAGQYGIMMNNEMGSWFLDATTGYKENISRATMLKALRPYYDEIAAGVDKIGKEITQEAKLKTLGKLYDSVYNKGVKSFFNIIKEGGEEYWKRAIIEGTEEVTEEAVMDMTKGVFDFMSYLGVGRNSDKASFGGFQNVFSQQGFERYLMSAIGGAVGGALFTFQGKVIEPKLHQAIGETLDPETKASLIHEIANGNIQEILDTIDSMVKADNKVLAVPLNVAGENVDMANNATNMTRGELIGNYLKKYVKSVEAIIQDNGVDLSDSQLFQKVIRDKALLPMLEESEVHKLILSDFNKAVSDLVDLQTKVDAEKSVNEKETGAKKGNKLKDLESQLKEKQKFIEQLLAGELDEKYLKISLAYLHKDIREKLLNLDKYSYTKSKYGVSYNELDTNTSLGVTQADVDKEYAEWKDQEKPEQKFIKVAVPAFDMMEQTLSPVIEDYVKNYKNVRAHSIKHILSDTNALLGGYISNDTWRKVLVRLSEQLSQKGQKPGMNLNDVFQIDPDMAMSIVNSVVTNHSKYFATLANIYNLPIEDVKKIFAENLASELERYPIQTLNKQMLDQMLYQASIPLSLKIVESLRGETNTALTPEVINQALINLGFQPITDPNITSEQQLIDAFTMQLTPRAAAGTDLDITTSVVMKYLADQDILDDEIVRTIKRALYQQIQGKHDSIASVVESIAVETEPNEFGETQLGTLSLDQSDFQLLDTKVYEGLNNNVPLSEIISDWLMNPEYGVIPKNHADDEAVKILVALDPEAPNKIISEILKVLNNSTVEAYEKLGSRQIAANPFFEMLRKFNFEVSAAGETNLMQLLEDESSHLSHLPSLDDYLRQGVTLEQIENFEKLLDLFEAVLIGMEDSPVSLGNPISYNAQLKRYKEKWGGEGANSYKLLPTDDLIAIDSDINYLRNKLQFLKGLINSNTASKQVENANTKINHQKLLLNQILTKCSDLKINGISIFPPRDEINKRTSDEEKLGYIEHEAHENFKKAVAKSNLADATKQMLEVLKVNKANLIKSGFESYGIDSKVERISEADVLTYLTTILSTDQHEFLARYKSLMNENWYDKVPFYAQEYAMKIGFGFYKDSLGLHKEIAKQLFEGKTDLELDNAFNLFFLNGISGAGKTSVVQKGIYYMMSAKEDVVIAAPNTNQAEKLATSLTENVQRKESKILNKKGLLELFFKGDFLAKLAADAKKPTAEDSNIKVVKVAGYSDRNKFSITPTDACIREDINPNDLPSIIFIDEVTHFNKAELQLLDFVAEKYGIKIFTSGDTLQRGAKIGKVNQSILDLFSWTTPRLLISVRAGTVEKKDNTDQAKVKLITIEDEITKNGINDSTEAKIQRMVRDSVFELKYYENDHELHGDKLIQDLNSADVDLRRLKSAVDNARAKNPNKNVKIGILADLKKNANGEWVLKDSQFEKKLQDLGLQEGSDYTLYYSPDDFSERAVQGSEEEYFIIKDLNIKSDFNTQDKLISFYTYITRSMTGGLIQIPIDLMRDLNVVNKKMSSTDSYSMPGLDRQTGLKSERIAAIEKIIGANYTITSEDPKAEAPKEEKGKPDDAGKKEAPKAEPKVIERVALTDNEKDKAFKEMATAEENLTTDKLNGEQPIQQETLKDQPTWSGEPHLPGYTFYEHGGIEGKSTKDSQGKETGYYRYYAAQQGTNLDFDSLIPANFYIPSTIRTGFYKFKRILSLYPNTASQEFKDAMNDVQVLDFFYFINPEIATHHNREDVDERRQDVYKYLVEDAHLKIDNSDYVFGKKFNSDVDHSRHFGSNSAKELKDGEILLLFGRRIYTDDHKIDQYMSMGVFLRDELARTSIDKVPSYDSIYKKVKEELVDSGVKLSVLKCAEGVRFKPINGIDLYKPKDPNPEDPNGIYTQSLDQMREEGYYFDCREIGMISGIPNAEGKYDFLEFVAEFEADGDENLRRKKLKELYKTTDNGGFIKVDPVTKNKSLSVAGKFFVPVKFTAANDKQYQRIVVLDPAEVTYETAIQEIKRLIKTTSESGSKDMWIPLQKAQSLSPYSQTKLVISVLKKIGAIDASGNDVLYETSTGERRSTVRLYLQKTLDQMRKIKGHSNSDISIIADMLEDPNISTFDEVVVADMLKQTKLFGIFFIDALIQQDEDSFYTLDLTSEDESGKPKVELTFDDPSDFGFRNYISDSEVTLMGHKFWTSSKFATEDYKVLYNLRLRGRFVQMPTFGLNEVILKTFKSVTFDSHPAKVPIDRSIAAYAQQAEDLSGKSWEELKKDFDPSKIKLIAPEIEYGAKEPTKKLTRDGHLSYTTPHLVNKWGWDIKEGDKVQLFNDESTIYTVEKIFKESKSILLSDKNGEKLTQSNRRTSVDSVTRVAVRYVKNWYDFTNYDYYGQVEKDEHGKVKIIGNHPIYTWRKKVKAKLDAAKKINPKSNVTTEKKVETLELFDASKIELTNSKFYIAIPFSKGQDYDNPNDLTDAWTMLDTVDPSNFEKQLNQLQAQVKTDGKAGLVLLHASKSKFSIMDKVKIEEALKKHFTENKTISGWVAKVLISQDSDYERPETHSDDSKYPVRVAVLGDWGRSIYDGARQHHKFTIPQEVVSTELEEGLRKTYPSKHFFAAKIEGGYMAIPNARFYEDNHLSSPVDLNNLAYKVGDLMTAVSEEGIPYNGHPAEVTGINNGKYEVKGSDGKVRTYDVNKVELLYGITFDKINPSGEQPAKEPTKEAPVEAPVENPGVNSGSLPNFPGIPTETVDHLFNLGLSEEIIHKLADYMQLVNTRPGILLSSVDLKYLGELAATFDGGDFIQEFLIDKKTGEFSLDFDTVNMLSAAFYTMREDNVHDFADVFTKKQDAEGEFYDLCNPFPF